MKKNRRKYSSKYKEKAVKLVTEQGYKMVDKNRPESAGVDQTVDQDAKKGLE